MTRVKLNVDGLEARALMAVLIAGPAPEPAGVKLSDVLVSSYTATTRDDGDAPALARPQGDPATLGVFVGVPGGEAVAKGQKTAGYDLATLKKV